MSGRPNPKEVGRALYDHLCSRFIGAPEQLRAVIFKFAPVALNKLPGGASVEVLAMSLIEALDHHGGIDALDEFSNKILADREAEDKTAARLEQLLAPRVSTPTTAARSESTHAPPPAAPGRQGRLTRLSWGSTKLTWRSLRYACMISACAIMDVGPVQTGQRAPVAAEWALSGERWRAVVGAALRRAVAGLASFVRSSERSAAAWPAAPPPPVVPAPEPSEPAVVLDRRDVRIKQAIERRCRVDSLIYQWSGELVRIDVSKTRTQEITAQPWHSSLSRERSFLECAQRAARGVTTQEPGPWRETVRCHIRNPS